ncbi:hypothetical protein IW18_20425 [Flavobacterium hibernum]|uniref:Uncharacterized protein n=2 Tax=Flavobacterium hibernum TaxID=37752 RepID=A0A0D0EDP3_9FLAO|nr:hypothetical protein IW18_20425 [Flavobacterium hibernum]OXA85196.1 hypothetical protein B0A73_17765 [Flavobacterium hibernum]
MNEGIEKRLAGRPFKMQEWVAELVNILNEEDILFLSDKDLVFLVNRRLPEENQISTSTFEKWKSGKYAPNEEVGKEFVACINLALIRQKQLLSKKMMEDNNGQWTRYAWIMERKFTEWNLKHISENINRNEQSTVINIQAGTEEQRKLIDNLINADFEEVKPIQLPKPKEVKSLTDNEKEDELPF